MNKKFSYLKGILAEFYVVFYLFCKFYKIISWRHKTSFGELDIIAVKGKKIYFIEVKYRSDRDVLLWSLSNYQINRMKNASSDFIMKNVKYCEYDMVFDAFFISFPYIFKRIRNITM